MAMRRIPKSAASVESELCPRNAMPVKGFLDAAYYYLYRRRSCDLFMFVWTLVLVESSRRHCIRERRIRAHNEVLCLHPCATIVLHVA